MSWASKDGHVSQLWCNDEQKCTIQIFMFLFFPASLNFQYYERNFEPRVGSALFFLRFKIFCSYFLFSFGRKEPSPWRKVNVRGRICLGSNLIFFMVQRKFYAVVKVTLSWHEKCTIATWSVIIVDRLIQFDLITTNFSPNYLPTKLWTLKICLKY